MKVRYVLPAIAGVLALGFSAAPSANLSTPAVSSAPGDVLATNPVGSLAWLPVDANETVPGFSNYRLVVTYDHSYDATGEEIDLLADAGFGMKIFADTIVDSNLADPPAFYMVGHSEHISSLDDIGAPGELDSAFIGVSGDVTDGDCARLDDGDASDMSYAYSTSFTVSGDVEAGECQLVTAQQTDDDGNVLNTTITTYVPGFWVDVHWPFESDSAGSGGEGHTRRQVWYGAIPGYSTSDPTAYAEAGESGFSNTVYNPMDEFGRFEVEDVTPGPGVSGALPGCPADTGTGSAFDVTVPPVPVGATGVIVDLIVEGDWDLNVTHNGETFSSGNFYVSERVVIPGVTEGDELTIEPCNFAGPPTAIVTVGWGGNGY